MPFRSGTLSARQYVIVGEVPEAFVRTATMALRRYAFRPIDADRGEREAFGWVNPRRPLDDRYTWEDVVDGPLAFLAVRRDRKSFNKVLFKARRDEAFARVKKEKGLERLTRQHRVAIEEELTIQMLREVTPATAFTELVWDMNSGDVLIGATGKALCERITELFTSTFDLRLAPQFPALLGHAFMTEQGLEENFHLANAAAQEAGDGHDG